MTYNPYQNKHAVARGEEIDLMDILGRVLDVPGDFKIVRDGRVEVTFTVSRLPDGSMEFVHVRETSMPATVPSPQLYPGKLASDKHVVSLADVKMGSIGYVAGDFSGYDMDGAD